MRIPYASGCAMCFFSSKALELLEREDPEEAARFKKEIQQNKFHGN